MRFQTRLIAVLWSLNFFTGVTPGRLFQMATSLSAGQALASCANSCSLVKLSNGVAVAAASGVPCAVMLFSVSMVNVILNLLGAALCAVITWITRNHLKSKAILT